jgi:hypothetical protein
MSTTGYIFGGPDRSGKTTIAKALAEMTGSQYYKNSNQSEFFKNRPEDFHLLLEYHGPAFLHFLENITIPGGIVIDRFTPCEYAYALAYKRFTNIPMILDIDARLANLGFTFVCCYKTRYTNWDDELVSRKKVGDLITNYMSYCQITSMPVVLLDTTDEDLNGQLSKILINKAMTYTSKRGNDGKQTYSLHSATVNSQQQ